MAIPKGGPIPYAIYLIEFSSKFKTKFDNIQINHQSSLRANNNLLSCKSNTKHYKTRTVQSAYAQFLDRYCFSEEYKLQIRKHLKFGKQSTYFFPTN